MIVRFIIEKVIQELIEVTDEEFKNLENMNNKDKEEFFEDKALFFNGDTESIYYNKVKEIKKMRKIITAKDIQEYKNRKSSLKTIGEFKALGREMKDTFNLSDREALDLLNGRNEIEILKKYQEK